MNYKYLSKYHYIYRVSFHDDYTAHIEKFPIAYANKIYMYIIEPGNPELRKLTLTPTARYYHGDIYTEVNDKVKSEIANRLNSRYRCSQLWRWFLVDDLALLKELIDELQHKTLQKLYLERELERLDLSVRNMKYDLEKKSKELENINQQLVDLEASGKF